MKISMIAFAVGSLVATGALAGTALGKETTSFIVFNTGTGFDTAASKFKAAIAPSTDLFLMRQMESKKAVICGHNEDDDIFDLMVDADGASYLRTL